MGKITDSINESIHLAMKSGDETKLSTLRLLASALSYEKIAQQRDLSDEEELGVVRKEAKKRSDAIEAYERVKAQDRADQEKKELVILKEFLPPEMNDSDLTKIVDETLTELSAKSPSDMGRVIGAVMGKVKGQADGKKVSEMVRIKLSGK